MENLVKVQTLPDTKGKKELKRMTYTRIDNIDVELCRFLRGRPSRVRPETLLRLIGPEHLRKAKSGARRRRDKQSLTDKDAYTPREVSRLMGFSIPTVIKLFEKEPGVIIVKRPETMHKRGYRSIRIPRAVYERVVRRLSV